MGKGTSLLTCDKHRINILYQYHWDIDKGKVGAKQGQSKVMVKSIKLFFKLC